MLLNVCCWTVIWIAKNHHNCLKCSLEWRQKPSLYHFSWTTLYTTILKAIFGFWGLDGCFVKGLKQIFYRPFLVPANSVNVRFVKLCIIHVWTVPVLMMIIILMDESSNSPVEMYTKFHQHCQLVWTHVQDQSLALLWWYARNWIDVVYAVYCQSLLTVWSSSVSLTEQQKALDLSLLIGYCMKFAALWNSKITTCVQIAPTVSCSVCVKNINDTW